MELISILPWITNTVIFLAYVPQIRIVHRLKSTSGISDFVILGSLCGFISGLYYVYGCNLPYQYKLFAPVYPAAVLYLVSQRIKYNPLNLKRFTRLFSFIMIVGIGLIPLFLAYPKNVGLAAGWASTIIWGVYLIPQVLKIYSSKSTEGFSFILVSCFALNALIEAVVAIHLNFPPVTLVNNARSLFIYLIFCVQFWLYNRRG